MSFDTVEETVEFLDGMKKPTTDAPVPETAKAESSSKPSQRVTPMADDHLQWFSFRAGLINNFGSFSSTSKGEAKYTSSASLMCYKRPKQVFYKIVEDSVIKLVTKQQYKEANPEKKVLPSSMLASENRNLMSKIRRKLSKLYRNKRAVVTACSKAKKLGNKLLPMPKKLRRMATIMALINHFFDDVLLKGMSIVPSDLESDKEVSDDEFFWKTVKWGATRGGPLVPQKRESTPKEKGEHTRRVRRHIG